MTISSPTPRSRAPKRRQPQPSGAQEGSGGGEPVRWADGGSSALPYRAFVELAGDGIVIVDCDGTIVEWNEGEAALTGIPRHEAIGRPIWEVQQRLVPDEEKDADSLRMTRDRVLRGLAEGARLRRTLAQTIQRPDGSRRVLHSVLFGIEGDGRLLAGGITRDITERHAPGGQRPVATHPDAGPRARRAGRADTGEDDAASLPPPKRRRGRRDGPPAAGPTPALQHDVRVEAVVTPDTLLSPRERAVLTLLAYGYSYRNIAARLGLSTHTVHAHIRSMYDKLRVGSRSEAVFEAVRRGILNMVRARAAQASESDPKR